MKTRILTLTLLAISIFNLQGQTSAKTKEGKQVILKDDGTWYYDTTKISEPKISLDCESLVEVTTDKMTGKVNKSAKKSVIVSSDGGQKGLGIFMFKSTTTGSIIMSIKAVGEGSCIDDDNKMNVLFRDGTRLELINNGSFNCKAKFTLYFGGNWGKKKQLEKLRTKEVETMRVWTSRGYVEEDFTKEQSLQLMKTIDCLINL